MSSNKKVKVIGLTGGIGTGKTTAAEYLAGYGLDHIDADAISRGLTGKGSPVLDLIADAFESENSSPAGPLITEDGELDRKAMAALVFSDPEKKARLEKIMFSEINKIFLQRIENADKPVAEVVFFHKAPALAGIFPVVRAEGNHGKAGILHR